MITKHQFALHLIRDSTVPPITVGMPLTQARLASRRVDPQVPLNSVAQALGFSDEQRHQVSEHCASFKKRQGGILRRILQPGQLMRGTGAAEAGAAAGTPRADKLSLAQDWVSFLTDDAAASGAEAVDPQSESQEHGGTVAATAV